MPLSYMPVGRCYEKLYQYDLTIGYFKKSLTKINDSGRNEEYLSACLHTSIGRRYQFKANDSLAITESLPRSC
ncbi:unnamed protein product, partial [Didymodactylos carnosus]